MRHTARSPSLTAGDTPASFTLLDHEVVFGRQPLNEFRGWDWGQRLVAAGIQRLEFDPHLTREQFDAFVEELHGWLVPVAMDTGENRQMRPLGIRFGGVGLEGVANRTRLPRFAASRRST